MSNLKGRKTVVTGGSRGLGRAIVEALDAAGAEVVAIARDEAPLAQLREATGGRVQTRAGDVADAKFAEQILRETRPDILVLNAGAQPRLMPLQEHTWESFSAPWETDVRATFHWSQLALRLPLAAGSTVLISSSGAAVAGSPLSGGYAGAKRMQWLMADYLQKESLAGKLGIRFQMLMPRGIVEATGLGASAVAAYTAAAGISREKYLERFGTMVTPAGFARGVVEILTAPTPDAVGYVVLEGRVQPIGLGLSPAEFGAMK